MAAGRIDGGGRQRDHRRHRGLRAAKSSMATRARGMGTLRRLPDDGFRSKRGRTPAKRKVSWGGRRPFPRNPCRPAFRF
jgi:hypothetical protein